MKGSWKYFNPSYQSFADIIPARLTVLLEQFSPDKHTVLEINKQKTAVFMQPKAIENLFLLCFISDMKKKKKKMTQIVSVVKRIVGD